jgi:hypothetical protein
MPLAERESEERVHQVHTQGREGGGEGVRCGMEWKVHTASIAANENRESLPEEAKKVQI